MRSSFKTPFKALCLAVTAALAVGTAARAEPEAKALTWTLVYTADTTAVVEGVTPRAGRYLDNIDLTADVDLAAAAGWAGATLHAYVLNNSGGAPNDVAGALQGVDNIEVTTPRLRLFEFWLQQSFAGDKASVLAGLYNLNSEFYSNAAAGLLINPSFGIGSELAATGPNGPSIFPSTALGARLNVDLGEGRYARTAVLNAKSGVLGDPGGVDWSFGDGVLMIGEAGIEGPTRVSIGAWRYSRRQDDIRAVDAAGAPRQRHAQGAYLLAERHLFGDDKGAQGAAFVRIGASDGATTPFKGGWQAGVRIDRPFASRPDSAVSFGVQQGLLDGRFRANLRDGGVRAGRAESGAEITYTDKLMSRLTVQPDLQWIHNAGGDRDARDRVLAAVRIKVDLGPASAE